MRILSLHRDADMERVPDFRDALDAQLVALTRIEARIALSDPTEREASGIRQSLTTAIPALWELHREITGALPISLTNTTVIAVHEPAAFEDHRLVEALLRQMGQRDPSAVREIAWTACFICRQWGEHLRIIARMTRRIQT